MPGGRRPRPGGRSPGRRGERPGATFRNGGAIGSGQDAPEHHRHREAGGDGKHGEARKAHQPDGDARTDGGADGVAQVAADDEVGGDPAPARVPGQAADGASALG